MCTLEGGENKSADDQICVRWREVKTSRRMTKYAYVGGR